jgi:tetratricopeptide (TPR) repeat protein
MQPILLAENLQLDRDTQATPVFRGFQEGSRAPRAVGRIISIEEGQATINLGSLDGLSKGSLVEVFRDSTLKDRVGNLHVKTVFREQARGQFESNGFESGYAVRVTDRDHLQALEQQASDLANRRDVRGARLAAAKAREWASAAALSISQKAGANELLAKLDFKANNVAAAEIHYRAALDMRTADPHGSTDDLAEVQNDLAALLILRGDYDSAERLLDQKPALASRPTLRAERLNNLGVLVETRGDRKQAESLYIQALAAFPKNNFKERNITKANLDRVKGPH